MRTLAPVLCLLLAGALLAQQDPSAFDIYEHGREAEKAGRMREAYLAYSQAAALDPSNRTYWQRSQAVRFRALLENMAGNRVTAALPPIEDDPPPALPEATEQDREAARQPLPPTRLKANDVRLDFDLRGDSRNLFESVAKPFGIDCVFDHDYQPVASVKFKVTRMDYREALYALEEATSSFAFPIAGKTIFVANDTPQKRTELEPFVAVSIPIPTAIAPADFNAIHTAVHQCLALERVVVDSANNTVIIRDRISKVLPAQALFRDLMRPTGQLTVELKLVEVSRNDMIEYGVTFPNVFSLSALTTYLQNQVQVPTSISGLFSFGGGKTLIGIGFIAPQLVAQLSDSRGKVLYDAEMSSVEGQAADMHVGERYPVATSGYFGPASFSGPGAYVPPPSFSYVDLGLEMKVTSKLHGTEEVTMDVDAEFKLLTGQSVNGSPIISNRVLKSNIRIPLGDWAVFSGLLNPTEAVSLSGIPGLSRIPALQFLTAQKTKTTTDDQLLVLVRPRLRSLPPGEYPTGMYRLGSDTRPMIPL